MTMSVLTSFLIEFDAPSHQIADYNAILKSREFQAWRGLHGTANTGDDISKYTVEILKKRFIKVHDSLYVALAKRTNGNERVVSQGLKVVAALDANGQAVNP